VKGFAASSRRALPHQLPPRIQQRVKAQNKTQCELVQPITVYQGFKVELGAELPSGGRRNGAEWCGSLRKQGGGWRRLIQSSNAEPGYIPFLLGSMQVAPASCDSFRHVFRVQAAAGTCGHRADSMPGSSPSPSLTAHREGPEKRPKVICMSYQKLVPLVLASGLHRLALARVWNMDRQWTGYAGQRTGFRLAMPCACLTRNNHDQQCHCRTAGIVHHSLRIRIKAEEYSVQHRFRRLPHTTESCTVGKENRAE